MAIFIHHLRLYEDIQSSLRSTWWYSAISKVPMTIFIHHSGKHDDIHPRNICSYEFSHDSVSSRDDTPLGDQYMWRYSATSAVDMSILHCEIRSTRLLCMRSGVHACFVWGQEYALVSCDIRSTRSFCVISEVRACFVWYQKYALVLCDIRSTRLFCVILGARACFVWYQEAHACFVWYQEYALVLCDIRSTRLFCVIYGVRAWCVSDQVYVLVLSTLASGM